MISSLSPASVVKQGIGLWESQVQEGGPWPSFKKSSLLSTSHYKSKKILVKNPAEGQDLAKCSKIDNYTVTW